jgi:hypothetical protein
LYYCDIVESTVRYSCPPFVPHPFKTVVKPTNSTFCIGK